MKTFFLVVLDIIGYLFLLVGLILLVADVAILVNHRNPTTDALALLGGGVLAVFIGAVLKDFVSRKAKRSFTGSLLEDLIITLLPPW